jgi:hypothetical protein
LLDGVRVSPTAVTPEKLALILAIVFADSDSTRTTRTPSPALSTCAIADVIA